MTKTLIVNADDFGRTPGISAAIREAHLNGIVSSTTAMVNIPGVLDEVRKAHDECPDLGIGVHLTLTFGPPCAPPEKVASLLNDQGQFLDRITIMEAPDRIDPAQVDIEMRSQINAFLETGVPLDHLDSHHHVVAFHPVLWEIYLSLAREFDCGVRPSFPSDVPEEELSLQYPEPALTFAKRDALERLRSSGIPYPNHFLASFFGPGATLTHLLTLLHCLPDGISELMCHPGYVDVGFLSSSSYAKEREEELSFLTHPAAREAIQQADIRLCTYRNAWG